METIQSYNEKNWEGVSIDVSFLNFIQWQLVRLLRVILVTFVKQVKKALSEKYKRHTVAKVLNAVMINDGGSEEDTHQMTKAESSDVVGESWTK